MKKLFAFCLIAAIFLASMGPAQAYRSRRGYARPVVYGAYQYQAPITPLERTIFSRRNGYAAPPRSVPPQTFVQPIPVVYPEPYYNNYYNAPAFQGSISIY